MPAPIVRATPPAGQSFPQNGTAQAAAQKPAPAAGTPLVAPNRPGQTQQHLAGWMEQHRNLPLADQQRALENEPGFRNLPQPEQTQLQNRLRQLNSMPAEQRQAAIAHTEAMERLQPKDRQAVRSTMSELGSMREDRRAAVARVFHNTLAMTPQQRQAYLNSPQFRSQYSDNERETLNHLLQIQPAASQAGFEWARPAAPPSPHD
jgi:hypothetical protein